MRIATWMLLGIATVAGATAGHRAGDQSRAPHIRIPRPARSQLQLNCQNYGQSVCDWRIRFRP